MINLIINTLTPRQIYIFNIIFNHIYKTDYRIIETNKNPDFKVDFSPEEAYIIYAEYKDKKALSIPNLEYLEYIDISYEICHIRVKGDFPKVFYCPDKDDFDFDVFSACFILMTEYFMYNQPIFDEYGRINEYQYDVYTKKIYEYPLVNIYADYLWEQLIERFPFLSRIERSFDYEITIDVDEPWLYLHKGIYSIFGKIKDRWTNNQENAARRHEVLKSKKDPYDNFDDLMEVMPPEKTTFFFLLNGRSNFDPKFTSWNLHYRKLIRKIAAKGYRIGIHPSYFSSLNKRLIMRQKEALEDIIDKEIDTSRQHFLKYRLPDTYEYLIEAGIKNEYSSCLVHFAGFKNFIACPFPSYDFKKRKATELIIHPCMFMDISLFKHMGLSPEDGFETIKTLIDRTFEVKGKFVFILHNNYFTDYNNMGQWKDVFKETVKYLKEKFDTVNSHNK